MPADPAKMMLGDRDNARQLDLINQKYYFDQPVYKQYLYYLQDLLSALLVIVLDQLLVQHQ